MNQAVGQFKRPRLKRTIEVIEAPGGDLHLMRAADVDVCIPNPSREDRALFDALQRGVPLGAMAAAFGRKLVHETIDQMVALDLLEDAAAIERLPGPVQERFDRQLRYFSEVSSLVPDPLTCQERLSDASVTVLGVGGLGGRVALELACCGVGKMILVDGDDVELSNLNRQIQFREADIGLSKVGQMAERITAFNSAIDVNPIRMQMKSQRDLESCIAGSDLVIDAADWPAHEIEPWCNAACFKLGIPYIAMSHFPPIARVGPLYIPGKTGCFECQLMRYRREYPLFDIAIQQRKGKQSPAATLGPACGVIAGFVGIEALHFLTSLVPPPAAGIGFTYDLRDMTVEHEKVVREPDCRVCAPPSSP